MSNPSHRVAASGAGRRFPVGAVSAFIERAGAAVGLADGDLELFVRGVLDADLRGIDSHGIFRVPLYGRGYLAGEINPRPRVQRVGGRGATELLDADRGLGVVIGQQAMLRAVELARVHGIGLVGVRESNHAGILATHVLHASAAGMIGSFTSNAPALMAPTGGRMPMLSNSPFAWAIPCDPHPIVLDMACSTVARGRIRLAAQRNEPIPREWATDADGVPTEDPHRAMEGLVLPMAGYKGYGIAFINEILAAVLPGALLSMDVSRAFLAEGATSLDAWHIGHLAIAIDIAAFGDPGIFIARVKELVERVRATPRAPGVERILVPGERERETRSERERDGIPISASVLDLLGAFAREVRITPLTEETT